MQRDLQALVADNGASVLLVTHDVAEAVLLADTVVVLSRRPTTVAPTGERSMPRPPVSVSAPAAPSPVRWGCGQWRFSG